MNTHGIDSEKNVSEIIEEYEKKIYDLMQLIEIGKGLNSTLIDYNKLIDSILLTCMGQMQLIKAGIFLKKEIDQNEFVFHRNYKGFELDHTVEYVIDSDSRLVHYLENNYKCYTMDELIDIFGGHEAIYSLKKINPCLIVPLKGKDKLNGIIILGERINNEDFTEDEMDYLLSIASLAGIAIQNAYLYEMATTDMMTKLKLHHFFQTTLIEERERAGKQKSPLSLIMIDIDHFKDFNDSHGHVCGDMLLKNVAALITDKIRQIDIASRYGGEEFAVILPDTDIEEAYIVAERIRSCIESSKIDYEGKKLGVTVSVGVTRYNLYGDKNNKDFVERADKALYVSKENGRNMTTVLR